MPRLLLTLSVLLLLAAPAAASERQYTSFEAPREILGADATVRSDTLDRIKGLGVRDLRILLYWKSVAPQADARSAPAMDERDPTSYDWGRYPAAIEAATQRGFRVQLVLTGPVPRWATRDKRDDRSRPSPNRFARFAQAAARRFGPQVARWSIWNEPNHPRFLLPQYEGGEVASGRIYRGLLRAGLRGIRAGGEQTEPILAGETAPRASSRSVAPLRFMRQALCLPSRGERARDCARLDIDGWAHHPYTTREGPWFVPSGRDDVTIGVLSRLVRGLQSAERAGAIPSRTGIFLTEFGIQSFPDRLSGVSFTSQAEQRSISELIARRTPRVKAFSQYLWRDSDPVAGPASARYSGFESGLISSGGGTKRALEGFRLPLVAERAGSRVRLSGLVRPAAGATSVLLEFRGRGGKAWHRLKRDRTDVRGAWATTTRSVEGRRYRVRWTAPDGTSHTGPLTRVTRPARHG